VNEPASLAAGAPLTLVVAPVRYVTIERFEALSGYTEKAVRAQITRGIWLQDRVFRKAPDGRILIDLQGYAAWAEGTEG
jgi:hypothetical protein